MTFAVYGTTWLVAIMRTALTGAAGGALASLIAIPLPWLIGSMLAVVAQSFTPFAVAMPRQMRDTAMLVLLTGIGMTFTVAAFHAAIRQAPAIIAAGFATILIGVALAPVIARLGGLDRITAFFCTVPGGPAEMSMLAEKLGVDPAPIAINQMLRIVTLVTVMPVAISSVAAHGAYDLRLAALPVVPAEAMVTLVLAAGAALALSRLGLSAAFIVGPLLVGALSSVSGMSASTLPHWAMSAAQVISGAYLGSRFTRGTIIALKPFLLVACASSFLLILLCVLTGVVLSYFNGQPAAVMALATAPGSITEMAITASFLGLDATMVLAFHIARIVIVMLLVQPCFRLLDHWEWFATPKGGASDPKG